MRQHLKIIGILSCVSSVVFACSAGPEREDHHVSSAIKVVDNARPSSKAKAWTHGGMVAAANPYAVEAAYTVLKQGGHAVDAAIAAHTVLGLVEPQSSGLGGGGLMLVYDRASGTVKLIDGRETAPAGLMSDLFVADGKSLGFIDAWQSGRAIGVPGVVALYKLAHDRYGKRPWAENFESGVKLASEGFVVSERMSKMLGRMKKYSRLDEIKNAADYFYPNGEPLAAGFLRKNPDYAKTLGRIADEGTSAFYRGEIASAIVAAAKEDPLPGTLTLEDLANYQAKIREPLCGPFYSLKVCSASAPGSGAGLIEMLGLYQRMIDQLKSEPTEEQKLLAFVDAQRLGYADRDHFIADSDFIPFSGEALYAPEYLDRRLKDRFKPAELPTHGKPNTPLNGAYFGPDTSEPQPSTTHLSIIDIYGNVVSFTATVEAPFGSSRWVGGFLLNNQLTDFSGRGKEKGYQSANAPAPGKRPRSSMSPTIVFDAEGIPNVVTGSPGGNSIIAYTFKSLLAVLAWGDDPDKAVARPNIVARGTNVRVEILKDGDKWAANTLRNLGYPVKEREGENSGIHLIQVTKQGLRGAADPRREGQVKKVDLEEITPH